MSDTGLTLIDWSFEKREVGALLCLSFYNFPSFLVHALTFSCNNLHGNCEVWCCSFILYEIYQVQLIHSESTFRKIKSRLRIENHVKKLLGLCFFLSQSGNWNNGPGHPFKFKLLPKWSNFFFFFFFFEKLMTILITAKKFLTFKMVSLWS